VKLATKLAIAAVLIPVAMFANRAHETAGPCLLATPASQTLSPLGLMAQTRRSRLVLEEARSVPAEVRFELLAPLGRSLEVAT
jgi:hypothetical protein